MIVALAIAQAAIGADVTGRVVDSSGVAVPGATIALYDQRLSYALDTSDDDGAFELLGLPANAYRVRILPPREANLVERYLPDVFDLCDGEVFELKRNGDFALGDAVVEAGGRITGRLLDSSGQPVEGALVTSHASASADASQSRYANSDAGGRWTLSGLSLDSGSDYVVEVEVEGWPDQYLPGVYQTELAPLTSFVELETDYIDVGDHSMLDGITVSGTAVGPAGVVTSGTAFVYSPSQLIEVPIEADGSWAVTGLPPGDVLVWAEVDGLATTYYPDVDRPLGRISVVEEGSVLVDVELTLPAESRIVGRIIADTDLSEVTLLAYNDDRTVAVSTLVTSDGRFEVGGLHGGNYTIQVFGEVAGLVSDELRDETGHPQIFSVPVADTLDLGDMDVPAGAVIKGTAVDAYSGKHVYGAFIYAESEEQGIITLAVADDRGRFELSGLREGTYRLWVDYQHYCDGDQDWVPRYWPDVVNPVLNGSVQIQTGETVQWNPSMPPDGDHDQMDDVWESDSGLDNRRDDGAEDPDGDGFTNLEEYQLGTDPLDGRNRHGCGCGGGRNGIWLFLLLPLFRRRS